MVAVRRSPEERERVKREAEEASYELGKEMPESLLRLRRLLRKAVKYAAASGTRVMVVLSGSDPVKVGVATAFTLITYEQVMRSLKGRPQIRVLYAFNQYFEDSQLRKELVKRSVKERGNLLKLSIIKSEDARRYLGTTFQGLVLDLVNDLRPNRLGILVGIVEGGGMIVLQAPSWDSWDQQLTEFKRNLVVPGHEQPRHVFISWFKRKLLEHNRNVFVIDLDNDRLVSGEPVKLPPAKEREVSLPEEAEFPRELYSLALTQDQVEAIRQAEWLIEPPGRGRRKLLVITADRGRGKSCAAGIAMAGLAKALGGQRRLRVVVTSPDLQNTQSLMELAKKAFEAEGLDVEVIADRGLIEGFKGKGFVIKYVSPDRVPEAEADIVIIDEASGLPVPLLHKIWRSHSRVLVASTVHGYEGAGRGFSVRFLGEVKQDPNTELRQFEMREPIRYSEDDPIEAWLFDVLLLDAEPAKLEEPDLADIKDGRLQYLVLEPEELFLKREDLLRQAFGIYVQAHYRNEPDDLALVADAPHYSIRAVATGSGRIVAASLLAEEGGLDEELCNTLLNQDKTKGNIIPDRVIKHLRVPSFGRLRGWRIVRIATHPSVQDRGVGSALLRFIYDEAVKRGYDWVGSGFGVNERLVRFWHRNGFQLIHVSPDRNPVSGEFTVLVLRPIGEQASKLAAVANREVKVKLLEALQDSYRGMEPDVAAAMLSSTAPATEEVPPLTELRYQRLWAYLYGPMTYETSNDVIKEVVSAYWARAPLDRGLLTREEELALIVKVMQGRPWPEVSRELGIQFEDALSLVRAAVRKIAERYYGLSEGSMKALGFDELDSPASAVGKK
ncbi:MAG: tRNA(Met) cytidine acetyltransferase TmcA [Acidilobus sp.]